MEAVDPFAQMPKTPEPIIARVRRTLAVDCAAVSCSEGADLDRVAGAAGSRPHLNVRRLDDDLLASGDRDVLILDHDRRD